VADWGKLIGSTSPESKLGLSVAVEHENLHANVHMTLFVTESLFSVQPDRAAQICGAACHIPKNCRKSLARSACSSARPDNEVVATDAL
jgi:hypothetical protein